MKIIEWIRGARRMLRGRYVRLLEEEIARLRAENLALLNSLLGTAGVPPLRIEIAPAAPAFSVAEIALATGGRIPAGGEKDSAGTKPGASRKEASAGGVNGAPLRRRSWQQIGRMLEIEEARREREHAARVAEIRERWSAEDSAAQVQAGKH